MWAFLLLRIKVWGCPDRGLSLLSTPLLLGDDARKDTGFTVFIPSLGGGHLECFSFLMLRNNAPVNMHIQIS